MKGSDSKLSTYKSRIYGFLSMIVFAFGGTDSIVADDIGNVNQPVVSDNLFNIDQEKTAKGIDKSILLPYNIRREATDTVASH